MLKLIDIQSLVVIIVTGLLFTIALFVKGMTHDILLEAGVLLVSIKIIMMSYKNSQHFTEVKRDLGEIKKLLADNMDNKKP